MLIKEAKEITGGLSAPSKMPGPAFNIPTTACIIGTILRNKKARRVSFVMHIIAAGIDSQM